jgi:succinate-semialdehyde dehydrogenase/glutarate-semialdehyde dehydrogenase
MEAFDNELFGPVASDEQRWCPCCGIANNNSQFGLGSGVFTKDTERGEKLALQLKQEVVL